MKKIKMTIAAAMFCAAAFAGYTAYEQATMTDAEHMMQANIEALTEGDELTEVYWQTMGYCQGAIRLVCTTNTYAYYCSTAYCVGDY